MRRLSLQGLGGGRGKNAQDPWPIQGGLGSGDRVRGHPVRLVPLPTGERGGQTVEGIIMGCVFELVSLVQAGLC